MVLALQFAILSALALLAFRVEGLGRRLDALHGHEPRRGDVGRPAAPDRPDELHRVVPAPEPDRPEAAAGALRHPAPPDGASPPGRQMPLGAEPAVSAPPARGVPPTVREGAATATASAAGGAPQRPGPDLELRFGRRWAALIGGGVTAFGLVLLLRHSFEMGYVSPAARLGAAGLLSLVLCASAEMFRRRGTFAALAAEGATAAGLARHAADIPSVLLGTGLGGLFASGYAADAVYGFVGTAPAFAFMAAAALSGLAASLAYGPALAALGHLAALGVPLLLGPPAGTVVAAYAALVGVAGYAAAHLGGWRRLENPAGALLLAWAVLLVRDPAVAVVSVPASAAALTFTALRLRPRAAWTDWRPAGDACAALLLMAAQGLLLAEHAAAWPDPSGGAAGAAVGAAVGAALGFAVLLAAFGFAATATRARAAAPAVAAALAGATALLAFGAIGIPSSAPSAVAAFALASAAVLGIAAAAMHRGSRRSPVTGLVGAGSAAALLAAGDLVLRSAGGADGRTLGLLAALQGAALVALSRPRRGAIPPRRQFATAAAASVGLALLGFALVCSWTGDGPLLTLVIALTGAGAAALAVLWSCSLFASVAGIAALPVLARAGFGVAGSAVAAGGAAGGGAALWPFLADTLLPGLALAGTAALLGRGVGAAAVHEADRAWLGLVGLRPPAPARGQAVSLALAGMGAGGLLVAALVGTLRWIALGAPCAALSAPTDVGLLCTLALSGALAASRLRRALPLPILGAASRAGAFAGLALAAAALAFNPFATGAPVGALPGLNLLALAYLLPAATAWRLAREFARPDRAGEAAPRRAATAAAVVSALAYATFSVSQVFQGSVLSLGRVAGPELWSYTAIWLLAATALMACGLWRRARDLRLAALGLVAATAAKVAFVDLADLDGVARAGSVLALGLVLLGLGMAYGRLARLERL